MAVYEISFSDIYKKLFVFFKDLKKLCPFGKVFSDKRKKYFQENIINTFFEHEKVFLFSGNYEKCFG